MTYTLLARCSKTGALGVGNRHLFPCRGQQMPAIASNVGAITAQAFFNTTAEGVGTASPGARPPSRASSRAAARCRQRFRVSPGGAR